MIAAYSGILSRVIGTPDSPFGTGGFAWLGLVTYSALATHATVSTAIAAIERTGSWKTEVRSDTQSELDAVEKRLAILAQPFPPRAAFRGRKRIRSRTASRDERAAHPSNVVPMPEARREAHTTDETRTSPRSIGWDISLIVDHIADFVRECLEPASGSSLGASELRATYEAWCADHDYEPLSQQKLGAELTGLGFTKWKSCGLIRYRDLQLVA